jgi:hypothetical protein
LRSRRAAPVMRSNVHHREATATMNRFNARLGPAQRNRLRERGKGMKRCGVAP